MQTKTIKMLRAANVSPHGFDFERWEKDQIIEECPADLADDLCHPQTLAAVEVTGNKKADEKAELDAMAEQESRDKANAAAQALSDAAAAAAVNAANAALGQS